MLDVTRRKVLAGAVAALATTATRSRGWASTLAESRRPAPVISSVLDEMLGESLAMRRMLDGTRQVLRALAAASWHPSILISGEPGCGKPLLVKTLHRAGARRGRPFVRVDTSMPTAFLEFELFGHEAGTLGAPQAKPGMIRVAHTGILCVEDIVALPREVVVELLDALQSGMVRRVAGGRVESVDVWLIGTTSRRTCVDLRFRSALIDIPPLRDRGDDVLLLADHYLARYADEHGLQARTLSRRARAALLAHGWPGNVRELIGRVERAARLSTSGTSSAICRSESGDWSGAAVQFVSRGSSASRRPSPRRFPPSTVSEIATPGAMATGSAAACRCRGTTAPPR